MLCFVVVMQSFIMNSHEVFIHIHQGCFAGNGAIVRLPQCQWSKPDGYGKISQCLNTTKHSKAKTVCIFLGIYCTHINTASNTSYCTLTLLKHRISIWNSNITEYLLPSLYISNAPSFWNFTKSTTVSIVFRRIWLLYHTLDPLTVLEC